MENREENIGTNLEPLKGLKRIDGHYVSHEISHLLHFEKGFFFTLKNLLLKPGKSIREFLLEDRQKYVKPILFLIVTSVIFTITLHSVDSNFSFFNIDNIEPLKGKLRSKEIGEWTDNHIGYSQLIMGIFIAYWIKIFFKNFKYNIYEILILLCYVLGEALFFLAVLILLAYIFKSGYLATFGVIFYFTYIIWAIGQFFGEKKVINYIKASLAYILGNVTYLGVLILIAYILKFI
ncbi:MAG: DUF3667 domain-containing protein [Leadbetterella sp.]